MVAWLAAYFCNSITAKQAGRTRELKKQLLATNGGKNPSVLN
jgi:hypothetical protein